MFTADASVEDPYGSRPHVGLEEIGRFYDTFIAPRQIIFHRDVDLAVGAAVVRDLKLEIVMAPEVRLDVPMHLRYDLRESDGDWMVEQAARTLGAADHGGSDAPARREVPAAVAAAGP